ncbi:MAG: hypothetical protein EXR72_18730 [Myxococcales bacterium]|nr:hypothetical protein [Myxococcales bacterium]
MTRRGEDLLRDALDLAVEERAHLAAELMASVDGAPDADAEEAWAVEIERRAKRALSEQAPGEDWSTVEARLAARLRRPR